LLRDADIPLAVFPNAELMVHSEIESAGADSSNRPGATASRQAALSHRRASFRLGNSLSQRERFFFANCQAPDTAGNSKNIQTIDAAVGER
jgi:hypothetical protein